MPRDRAYNNLDKWDQTDYWIIQACLCLWSTMQLGESSDVYDASPKRKPNKLKTVGGRCSDLRNLQVYWLLGTHPWTNTIHCSLNLDVYSHSRILHTKYSVYSCLKILHSNLNLLWCLISILAWIYCRLSAVANEFVQVWLFVLMWLYHINLDITYHR